MKKSAPVLVLLVFFSLLHACIQDPVSVLDGGEMEIRLHVTGGFAGADYVVFLDGASRTLVGESCVNLCDFAEGELLQSLTPEQVEYVWVLFRDAGIHALDGEDFGVQCCDQFHFDVEYRDSKGRSRVKGSSEVLPNGLKAAVATLQGMVSGTLPVIVNFDTNPESWPQDSFQIQSAEVSDHTLQITLSYGGGCRTHDVRAVAWGGWMESNPVQVRLFLSHEDFDDPCDAWVTRDFKFDLVPLKIAYQASYGVGEPEKTTLILLLADPMLASPQGARWLEY
ncbi:MAG: hypothetical protein ABIF09_08120, partial [Gemmatimonadota bacterium]